MLYHMNEQVRLLWWTVATSLLLVVTVAQNTDVDIIKASTIVTIMKTTTTATNASITNTTLSTNNAKTTTEIRPNIRTTTSMFDSNPAPTTLLRDLLPPILVGVAVAVVLLVVVMIAAALCACWKSHVQKNKKSGSNEKKPLYKNPNSSRPHHHSYHHQSIWTRTKRKLYSKHTNNAPLSVAPSSMFDDSDSNQTNLQKIGELDNKKLPHH